MKVIEANKNRPFFLYLAHWAIHTPLQATRDDYDAYPEIESHTERTYAGMIRGLDRSVGRVLDALEQHGLTDNTLVIFSSDNGGAGYIGLPNVNSPFRGWKLQRSGPNNEFLWLFNLNDDFTEQVNLADQRPDKVAELDALLSAHLSAQVPPRWPHRSSNPIAIDRHLNQPEEAGDKFVYYPN